MKSKNLGRFFTVIDNNRIIYTERKNGRSKKLSFMYVIILQYIDIYERVPVNRFPRIQSKYRKIL